MQMSAERRTVFHSIWPASADQLDAFFAEHGHRIHLDPSKFMILQYEEYKQLYEILYDPAVDITLLHPGVLGKFQGRIMNLAIEIELADSIQTMDSMHAVPTALGINLSRIKSHLNPLAKGVIVKLSTRGSVGYCVNIISPDPMRVVIRANGLIRVQLHRAARKSVWAALMGLEWVIQRLQECELPRFHVHCLQICNQSCSVSLPQLLCNWDPYVAQLYAKTWRARFGRGLTSDATDIDPDDSHSYLMGKRKLTIAERAKQAALSSRLLKKKRRDAWRSLGQPQYVDFYSDASRPKTTTSSAASASTGGPQMFDASLSQTSFGAGRSTWEDIKLTYYAWYNVAETLSTKKSTSSVPTRLRCPIGTILPSHPPSLTRRSLAGGRDLVTYSKLPASAETNWEKYKRLVCDIVKVPEAGFDDVLHREHADRCGPVQEILQFSDFESLKKRIGEVEKMPFSSCHLLDIVQPLFCEKTNVTAVRCRQDEMPPILSNIVHAVDAYFSQALSQSVQSAGLAPSVFISTKGLALLKATSGMDACHVMLKEHSPPIFKSNIVNMASKVIFLEAASRFGILTTRNSLGKPAAASSFAEFISYSFKIRYMEQLVIYLIWTLRLLARTLLEEYTITPHQALNEVGRYFKDTYIPSHADRVIEFPQTSKQRYVSLHLSEALRLEIQNETLRQLKSLLDHCCKCESGKPHAHNHDTSSDLEEALVQLSVLAQSDRYYQKCVMLDAASKGDKVKSKRKRADSKTGADLSEMLRQENTEREKILLLCRLNPYLNRKLKLASYPTASNLKHLKRKMGPKGALGQAPSAATQPTVCIGTLVMFHMSVDTVDNKDNIDLGFESILQSTSTRPGPRGCIYHYLQDWANIF